jgi:predicted ATPase with chaperone activity
VVVTVKSCTLVGSDAERVEVARTIADVLGQDEVDAGCLLEAAAYREVGAAARVAEVG